MKELMNILTELKPDVDFNEEKGLVDNGILDSFDIVQLISQLKETFDIEISPAEIIPENFNSAEALWKMVERLQD
ncbi:MAG: acyl carrier protein [Treponema sp.]|nr:acyl carrier protein [Treponema sp.]